MPHDPCDTIFLATAAPKPPARLTKPGSPPVGGSRQQPGVPTRTGRADGKSSGAGTGAAKQSRGVAMAMADRLAGDLRRLFASSLLVATAALSAGAVNAAVISVGTPMTTVPDYLAVSLDPITQFLLPVEISGAVNLQDWQFDLTFDNSVVRVVDPLDGTSGIYGAQFTPGDADSLSFILDGLPLNDQGLVEDVAGSYPNVFNGVTGGGVLAFILFEYLTEQEGDDPNFGIGSPPVQPVPEPGTMVLLTAALLPLAWNSRRGRRGPRATSR